MKKVLCIAIALVLAVAAFAVPVSAATPKEELAASVKAAIPKGYNDLFVATVDNVLKQIDVSKEQADQVIAIINETTAKVKDKGSSLHEYTKDEVSYILAQFGKACSVLNLTYKVVAKKMLSTQVMWFVNFTTTAHLSELLTVIQALSRQVLICQTPFQHWQLPAA